VTIALRVLAVDEESLRHDQMEVVLCAGHRHVPGSRLPDELRAAGYDAIAAGITERILPHQIVQRFVRRVDGELEPLTEESTKPIAETRTHAGIVSVRRWTFTLR
jgi:hypothetical protein